MKYDTDDERMMAYIDQVIVGDRTSDAADDSAGAAWAAYQRGEFEVPAWFSGNHPGMKYSSPEPESEIKIHKPRLTFDAFLKSMGVLFLVILFFFLVLFLVGYL